MPRTRSTIAKFNQDEAASENVVDDSPNANGDNHSSGGQDDAVAKMLDIASSISSSMENEEKIILLTKLRRLLDGIQVTQCEPELKNLSFQQRSLKDSLDNVFVQSGASLMSLLDALGVLLESSLKSGIQESLTVLNVLMNITSSYYGRRVTAQNLRIMIWLFDKLDPEDPAMVNNRDSEIMDLVLSLLQRCSRMYQIQNYDGWLRKTVETLKVQLLQDVEFQDRRSMIMLDILLNICTCNRGRLPLIEQQDLKKILTHISEFKGAKVDEIRIMTARLQLLLTPFDLTIDDVDLAPLSINRVIGILQRTIEQPNSSSTLTHCMEFLNDIINFAPSSVEMHERHWLLLIEEFLSLSEEDKKTWYNFLAEPLLELLCSLHRDEVKLLISDNALEVINNWAAEFCPIVLIEILNLGVSNAATRTILSKAYLLFAKSLASLEIWSRIPPRLKADLISFVTTDVVETLKAEDEDFSDFDMSYLIGAAKLLARVANLDGKFNSSLSNTLADTPLLSAKNTNNQDLALACIILATHLAEFFPNCWLEKTHEYFERDDVCKHVVNALRYASHEVVIDLNLAIAKFFTETARCRLRKYMRLADVEYPNRTFQNDSQLSKKLSSNSSDQSIKSNANQEIITEYESKLQICNLEKQQYQKTLTLMRDMLDLCITKEKSMEEERAKLVRRNLEQMAENNDLMLKLRKMDHEIKDLQSYGTRLKKIADNVRVDLELKTKEMVKAEKELAEFKQAMEQFQHEKAEMKKNLTVQEQKISKYRQLAQDNKQEMAKQEEILVKKEEMLKTLKEENKELLAEIDELQKFKENILNITSKARAK